MLCCIWISRRRYVSSIATFIDRVIVSAYMMTCAVDVSCCASDRLNERSLRPEESFLVGIENRDQRNFGKVETLPQEVDADDDVVNAKAKIAQNLDPLERIDFAVEVMRSNAHLLEVVGEIFRHSLGERCDQHAFALGQRAG